MFLEGDIPTTAEAIEKLAQAVQTGLERVAEAIEELALAVRETGE